MVFEHFGTANLQRENFAAALSAVPQPDHCCWLASSKRDSALQTTESAAVITEIADSGACCWLSLQLRWLARVCSAHGDYTQAYRSVIFAVYM